MLSYTYMYIYAVACAEFIFQHTISQVPVKQTWWCFWDILYEQVTHICANKLDHQGSIWCFAACLAARCYLNQYWSIINWALTNIFHWIFNENATIFIKVNGMESVVGKMAAIYFRLNVFIISSTWRLSNADGEIATQTKPSVYSHSI